jgi:hypothetical protein
MDFNIDSDNIEIIIKENKQSLSERQINHKISPQQSNSGLFDLSSDNTIRFEIILKLDDYYLINNIKLFGDIDEQNIHKIKFKNVRTGHWELVNYFNPDKKEIIIKENE